MTKNIVAVTAVLLCAGTLTGCDFEQPDSGCIVQDASFAVWYAKYDLMPGQNITAECQAKIIKGENLGVFKFTNPEQAGQTVLTLRPANLYTRASRDPGDPYLQTAVGKLADETDADSFCKATGFSAATVNAGPRTSTPPEPATTITYQYENVKVYAAPRAPGTQLTGELTYTRDGCVSKYKVRALWPLAACDPAEPVGSAANCGAGSGVNPDFAVVCDAELLRCVAAKEIPSFKE